MVNVNLEKVYKGKMISNIRISSHYVWLYLFLEDQAIICTPQNKYTFNYNGCL